MFRILATGSREWTDMLAILDAFGPFYWKFQEDVILSVGDCPTGLDHMANRIARTYGWQVAEFRANWGKFGAAAGPRRNKVMVDAGADLCMAFLLPCRKPSCPESDFHWSHGTGGCMELARKAGIPVTEIVGNP